MKSSVRLIFFIVPLALLAIGCQKDSGIAGTSTSSAAKPAGSSPSPATPSGPPANASDQSGATASAKLEGAAWALQQDEIKHDPNGQWAIQASASSTYNDAQGTAGWSANQATGAPNVDTYGDNGNAWTSKTPDSGIEWLDLKFPKPVYASEVRIRESCGSGAVIKVELFDEQSGAHTAWAGNDPTTGLNFFLVKFPKMAFKTDRVKITLATNVVPGWNEIDAVQLVGTDQ